MTSSRPWPTISSGRSARSPPSAPTTFAAKHIPLASGELDAIGAHLEEATGTILNSCEQLEAIGRGAGGEVETGITDYRHPRLRGLQFPGHHRPAHHQARRHPADDRGADRAAAGAGQSRAWPGGATPAGRTFISGCSCRPSQWPAASRCRQQPGRHRRSLWRRSPDEVRRRPTRDGHVNLDGMGGAGRPCPAALALRPSRPRAIAAPIAFSGNRGGGDSAGSELRLAASRGAGVGRLTLEDPSGLHVRVREEGAGLRLETHPILPTGARVLALALQPWITAASLDDEGLLLKLAGGVEHSIRREGRTKLVLEFKMPSRRSPPSPARRPEVLTALAPAAGPPLVAAPSRSPPSRRYGFVGTAGAGRGLQASRGALGRVRSVATRACRAFPSPGVQELPTLEQPDLAAFRFRVPLSACRACRAF